MSARSQSWEDLQKALSVHTPACEDNDLFITDWFPAEVLKPLCQQCPVYEPCRSYALKNKPKGGIWAGMKFDHNGKKIS